MTATAREHLTRPLAWHEEGAPLNKREAGNRNNREGQTTQKSRRRLEKRSTRPEDKKRDARLTCALEESCHVESTPTASRRRWRHEEESSGSAHGCGLRQRTTSSRASPQFEAH